MNWINNVVRPKIQRVFRKKADTPDNLWHKCPSCGEMIFHRDLDAAQRVCPSCDHHMRIGTKERFASLFDNGEYQTVDTKRAMRNAAGRAFSTRPSIPGASSSIH